MDFLHVSAALLLFGVGCMCSPAESEDILMIYKKKVDADAYPFILNSKSLYSTAWETFSLQQCIAVLYKPQFMMTAAHCLGISTVRVAYCGDQERHVIKVIKRPRSDYDDIFYSRPYLSNDIAVLKLDMPFIIDDKCQVATLPTNDSASITNSSASVIGYAYPKNSSELVESDMTVMPDSGCVANYGNLVDPAMQICLKDYRKNGSVLCSGDAGSPAIVDGEVVGLASWTRTTCLMGDLSGPAVFVRVSFHVLWLESVASTQ